MVLGLPPFRPWALAASSPLIDEYLVLNPGFNINYELCKYYHLQRFLEDLRMDFEKPALTEGQRNENLSYFFKQRTWDRFYKMFK